MHSLIERKSKKTDVYTVQEWCNVMLSAKVNPPLYIVNTLDQSEVYNFSLLSHKNEWNKVHTSKLCEIIVSPDKTIQIKYDFSEESQTFHMDYNDEKLVNAYSENIKLSKEKVKDIKDLCEDLIIPARYHDYYTSLIQ